MRPGSGMMDRHHASVPERYSGMKNPVDSDEDSLARGSELFTACCASCHGDGGMGDGPASAALDPLPSPVAHTSMMLGDDFLFWRISEGGAMAPFNSSMPAWKDAMDEQARWDLVNYIRALGRGQVTPMHSVGGAAYDPEEEEAARAEMLSKAVGEGVTTQEEADLFERVHAAMDKLAVSGQAETGGAMAHMRDTLLALLVERGEITQEEADAFNDIHDRLVESGLME